MSKLKKVAAFRHTLSARVRFIRQLKQAGVLRFNETSLEYEILQ